LNRECHELEFKRRRKEMRGGLVKSGGGGGTDVTQASQSASNSYDQASKAHRQSVVAASSIHNTTATEHHKTTSSKSSSEAIQSQFNTAAAASSTNAGIAYQKLAVADQSKGGSLAQLRYEDGSAASENDRSTTSLSSHSTASGKMVVAGRDNVVEQLLQHNDSVPGNLVALTRSLGASTKGTDITALLNAINAVTMAFSNKP
jgi:hypothetical protein